MEASKDKRVVFERGHPATIMAIDGTWGRPCTMLDVSDSGARLSIDGSIEGLRMSEFFLVFRAWEKRIGAASSLGSTAIRLVSNF
jgi:hypothetical protein